MIKIAIIESDDLVRRQTTEELKELLKDYEFYILPIAVEHIVIGNSSEQHKVLFEDIICIQKVKGTKYVEYILADATYRDRRTIEQIMETASYYGFVMVEKGHLVNLKYVSSMVGNVITMSNGMEQIISRTRIQSVRSALNAYWGLE